MIYVKELDRNNKSYEYEHFQCYDLLFESVNSERGLRLTFEDVEKDSYGKPYFPKYPHIHFSLTHCTGLAACFISGSECGIDAEMIRPCRYKAAQRVFSEGELAELERRQGRSSHEGDVFFISLWTLKEAYSKVCGRGLAAIKEANFSGDGERIISNFPRYNFGQYLRGEHIVSVCTEEMLPQTDMKEYYPF